MIKRPHQADEIETVTNIRAMIRAGLLIFLAILIPAMTIQSASAAPFAAFVMDGRTGKEIHSQNADTRLHPASLTKMMTLYMAFTAIERGQVRLDTRFTVSARAAAEPPSRLGLRAGQQIELRYLIRAAAVKSANDAATVIAENLGGSVGQFSGQMTGMAQALGMRNSQFRNANGLTEAGHFSTARDMSLLGRRLFYDFPQYYSIFSRRSADAGIATVRSTNRTFLDSYSGADGIKTGYTRAAGFNLTASAQRGSKRIIATVLGGTSTAQRNATMGQLLDMGFGRAPTRVKEVKPDAPQYIVERKSTRRVAAPERSAPVQVSAKAPAVRPAAAASAAGKALNTALDKAMAEPAAPDVATVDAPKTILTLARSRPPLARPGQSPASVEQAAVVVQAGNAGGGLASSVRPRSAPRRDRAEAPASQPDAAPAQSASTAGLETSPKPQRRSETVILGTGTTDVPERKPTEKVARASSSGGQAWSISIGRFRTREQANERLIQVAQQESEALSKTLRHIRESSKGYEATFVGLTSGQAARTCAVLTGQGADCLAKAP